ncbi:hypothetical protein FAGAP_7448 [Fusarium agapanthi]|uniref:Uncharacterized protein n=1 Tax=Fusarium agapanthi TaxID=1803897 RepID=A0A9P5E5N2_9HYPO|nr:hypothetical protein FAGAP_7448 [Fusarium agapanthi]
MAEGGPPPTPSKRARAKALEDQRIDEGVEFESVLLCIRCFKSALTVASTSIAAHPEHPIDVPALDCKFPFIDSKNMPAMMNGNYMDIISIFKAAETVPDSKESNSTKPNSTTLVKLAQRFQVLVNTHALTHDDIV